MNTLFGTKRRMSQTFIEGSRVPVTNLMMGPCTVIQIKNDTKDGYWALQLGFGNKKVKRITKPLQGHTKNSKTTPEYIREIRFQEEPTKNNGEVIKVGDQILASDIFKVGDLVEIRSTTKGKGFAGGVRRYNFRGGPKTHGQSDRHRAPGSVGQTTTPGRVYKGKRMAGRMGGTDVTIKNLHVVEVNKDKNEVLVSGAVPGRFGTFLTMKRIKAGSLHDLKEEVVVQNVETQEEVKEANNNES